MSDIASLAGAIFKHAAGRGRYMVAIAGPPAAGKSTLAERLAQLFPRDTAIVVPMDGFHFDDVVLNQRGLRSRKGAPETFDYFGFETLLKRIRANESEVAAPVFDRTIELSRAGAAIVGRETRFILVEGNYLLLDEEPWIRLRALFDYTVYVDVARDELERRLVRRWDEHGRTRDDALAWIASNDMPNIDRVLTRRGAADFVLR